jgi:small multidrug resistance pump
MQSYLLLLCAIAAEIAATTALKASDGFTRPLPTVTVVLGYGVAFYLLSVVLQRLELGVVYATWSALGTAAVAVIGVYLYGDALTPGRVVGLVLVIVGVAILNFSGA